MLREFKVAQERRFAWSGLGAEDWRWVQAALWGLWACLSPLGSQRREVEALVEAIGLGERCLTASETELARRAIAKFITGTRAGDEHQEEWMRIHNELAAISFRFYKVYMEGREPRPVPGSTEHW